MKTILLLGKNDVVEEYAEKILKIEDKDDILYCPDMTDHHTEFGRYINFAKEDKHSVITTQNLEMIDVLLASDLDFKVVTVRRYNDEIKAAIRTKEYVNDCREAFSFDPRD